MTTRSERLAGIAMDLRRWAARYGDGLCVAVLLALSVYMFQGIVRGEFGMGPEALIDGDAMYGTSAPSVRPYGDITPIQIEAPRDRWIAERARGGHLDLWNPFEGAGMPMPPDHGGLFSPLRLPHLVMPDQTGYAIFHCLRAFVAAVGAFFLARHARTSRPAALVCGVAFGFGGGIIGQLPYVSTGPVCVMPWLLLAQERLARRIAFQPPRWSASRSH